MRRPILRAVDPAQLKEEDRPKLADLLKQADQAIATSDKSGAAMDHAKAAMDAGNLAEAARGYESVAGCCSTRPDQGERQDSTGGTSKGEAEGDGAAVEKQLLGAAVASYDAGRLDESQNALNTIEASGCDLGDDSAKVSKYRS